MTMTLPEAIERYFIACNSNDAGLLASCFVEDAVVRDENAEHRGHAAIANWLREAQRRYDYRAMPLDTSGSGAAVCVRARISGSFPGSPIELNHRFDLTRGRISTLVIGD